MRALFKWLGDLMFGKPGRIGTTDSRGDLSREEFERWRSEQEWRKRRVETEAHLWVANG